MIKYRRTDKWHRICVRFLGYNLDIYEEFEAVPVCVCFIVDDLVLERTKRREFGGSRSERARVSGGLRLGGLSGPILISFYRTGYFSWRV